MTHPARERDWTPEIPRRPGIYYLRVPGSHAVLGVVDWHVDGCLHVRFTTASRSRPLRDPALADAEWSGPLHRFEPRSAG